MNVICLVVDGLQPAYLGGYGNGWVETPQLDRLAADGFVFDQAYAGSPCLQAFYAGAWQGRASAASAAGSEPAEPRPSLPASLPGWFRAAGFYTALITDEPLLAQLPAAGDFDQRHELPPPCATATAEDDEHTAVAAVIAAALDLLEGPSAEPGEEQELSPVAAALPSPHLLWIHLRGMLAPWDAPRERRTRYADDDDPEPPDFVEPPHELLPPETDPDRLWGMRQAYAGQVTLIDEWVGALLDWIEASPRGDDTLLCLISARGYPLGVHGRLGYPPHTPVSLYSEATHLAWMLRFPRRAHAAGRSSALVEPGDLPATLAEAANLPLPEANAGWLPSLMPVVRGDAAQTRDRLLLAAADSAALRTSAWVLFLPASPGPEGDHRPATPELYAKPDDRWEVNEVASRCPDVVEKLATLLVEQRRRLQGDAVELTPLDEELNSGSA